MQRSVPKKGDFDGGVPRIWESGKSGELKLDKDPVAYTWNQEHGHANATLPWHRKASKSSEIFSIGTVMVSGVVAGRSSFLA